MQHIIDSVKGINEECIKENKRLLESLEGFSKHNKIKSESKISTPPNKSQCSTPKHKSNLN